jgi:iron complex outermembrane receptor protein
MAPAGAPSLALTVLRAIYDQASAGARGQPPAGRAEASLYGELAGRKRPGRFGAALETIANGKRVSGRCEYRQPAPGYAIVNARVQASQAWAAGASRSSRA